MDFWKNLFNLWTAPKSGEKYYDMPIAHNQWFAQSFIGLIFTDEI